MLAFFLVIKDSDGHGRMDLIMKKEYKQTQAENGRLGPSLLGFVPKRASNATSYC